MKLSGNLTLREVIKSNTATFHNIDNTPTEEHLLNLKFIANNIFQPLRDSLGTIFVSSAYRSEALNTKIKGSKTSQHCEGKALDLDNDFRNGCATNKEIFYYIKDNLEFDQLIWEFGSDEGPSWVHVSCEPNGMNRKQVLKAIKVKGITKYIPFDL